MIIKAPDKIEDCRAVKREKIDLTIQNIITRSAV